MIGLGLGDERDITLRGLDAVQRCSKVRATTTTVLARVRLLRRSAAAAYARARCAARAQVYLEAYTSILGVDTAKLVRSRRLRRKSGVRSARRCAQRRDRAACCAARTACVYAARRRAFVPACAALRSHVTAAHVRRLLRRAAQEALYGKPVELADRERVEQARLAAARRVTCAGMRASWAASRALRRLTQSGLLRASRTFWRRRCLLTWRSWWWATRLRRRRTRTCSCERGAHMRRLLSLQLVALPFHTTRLTRLSALCSRPQAKGRRREGHPQRVHHERGASASVISITLPRQR